MGGEVLIPKILSQESLPSSMRFYDSIFQIMKDKISDDSK